MPTLLTNGALGGWLMCVKIPVPTGDGAWVLDRYANSLYLHAKAKHPVVEGIWIDSETFCSGDDLALTVVSLSNDLFELLAVFRFQVLNQGGISHWLHYSTILVSPSPKRTPIQSVALSYHNG